ncbi:MAG: hypothetical protein H4O13_09680 [Xanthomonadales bacterium]|nr:hypothetical protein [Xanthomonadales bacterium]
MDAEFDSHARIGHGLSALVLGLLLWGPVPPMELLKIVWVLVVTLAR